MTLRSGLLVLVALGFSWPLAGAERGAEVVVVFNSRVPESRDVALHYVQKRGVPSGQVFGFELPITETMTRLQYLKELEQPLLRKLVEGKFLEFGPPPPGSASSNEVCRAATVRYVLLCYGIPSRIPKDPDLVEPETERLPQELRRNEASVDNQLACLPLVRQKLNWTGLVQNPAYTATNLSRLHPTNGILMVTRLDGPSAAIARGLVDKAIQAETYGLWGKSYFDLRGITNGPFKLGDDVITGAAGVCQRMGFDPAVDDKPGTFTPGYPMSQISFYAGWYDEHVSGPFTKEEVDFMPGAFAYHLHSFNAASVRSATQHWVGPLLAKGATATFGTVDEPYLSGTLDVATFCARFIMGGFTFGEAAYAGQAVLSWQGVAIGDPLYRPFGTRPDVLHARLEKEKHPWLEWSHWRVANLNVALGYPLQDAINYLEKQPITRTSAVLTEKLADIYWANKNLSDALTTYESALKLNPSEPQKLRIWLVLAERCNIYGGKERALELYELALGKTEFPADRLGLYEKMLPIAKRLADKARVEKIESEIRRLKPADSLPKQGPS